MSFMPSLWRSKSRVENSNRIRSLPAQSGRDGRFAKSKGGLAPAFGGQAGWQLNKRKEQENGHMGIIEDLKIIKSDKKTLERFGLTLGFAFLAFFVIFGVNQFPQKHDRWIYCVYAAFFFNFLGLFVPLSLKPVQKVWMGIAVLMGFVMTRVILFILFFLVVTPIAFIARRCGNAFLDLGWKDASGSHWHQRADRSPEEEKAGFEKQF